VADLNPAQLAAATHGDGPLLIIAGAGTGKTRTLVHRVAHLIQRGVRPERMLLLTFTRRAAQEMLGRVERLAGHTGRQVHGGTFHATAHRLLRRFGAAAGVPSDFTIMDQEDAQDLMHLARSHLGYGEKRRGDAASAAGAASGGGTGASAAGKRFPKKETLHYVYSRHVNTEIPVATILTEEFPPFADYLPDFTRIFADYTRRKGDRNLVDYDDLLLFWAAMLDTSTEVSARLAGLYDHILVDEYQDTNLLQSRILRGMCRHHQNATVVGDDAQSIYSFRGASFRNILEFPAQFPGTTVVTLEQNYRSSQPILDTTNTLISRARERYTKVLWTTRTGGDRPWLVTARDEEEQTQFVVDRILELYEGGTPLREMAVLFRAGYMSAAIEIELTNRKIPFVKWGGLRFLEAAHVKDVLAFLRVLENPRDDVSWYRILLLLPGIGELTARAAIAAMAQAAWESAAFARYVPPSRARAAHASLVSMLDTLRSGAVEQPVSADIARVRQLYDDILRERYDQAEPRLADLDQLETIAGSYPSRSAFLAALALEPPSNTHDLAVGDHEEEDVLVLSTAHSAKGKEWDAVFLIWAVDGWFPTSRALNDDAGLEEERRLMYVALTRARHHLAVTYPLQVYGSRRGADYSIDQLSRFIDRGVREKMERVVVGTPDPAPSAGAAPVLTTIDLRALLRERFGAAEGP
jgi:DNA helicase II / ATP-dependent DNA helicase PcrA